MKEEQEELRPLGDKDSQSKSSSNQAIMVNTMPTVSSDIKEEADDCAIEHDNEDCETKRSLNIITVMVDTGPAVSPDMKEEAEDCPTMPDNEDCETKRSLNIITVMADIRPTTVPNVKEDRSVDGQDSEMKGSTSDQRAGSPLITQGDIDAFRDPHATDNMSPEETRTFQVRKGRYLHIRRVAKGYRKMERRYRAYRAAGRWKSLPKVVLHRMQRDTQAIPGPSGDRRGSRHGQRSAHHTETPHRQAAATGSAPSQPNGEGTATLPSAALIHRFALRDRRCIMDMNVTLAQIKREMEEASTHLQDIKTALGLPF